MSRREEAVAMLKDLPENKLDSVLAYMSEIDDLKGENGVRSGHNDDNSDEKCFEGNVGFLFESLFG